jgi:hypothetical protein
MDEDPSFTWDDAYNTIVKVLGKEMIHSFTMGVGKYLWMMMAGVIIVYGLKIQMQRILPMEP